MSSAPDRGRAQGAALRAVVAIHIPALEGHAPLQRLLLDHAAPEAIHSCQPSKCDFPRRCWYSGPSKPCAGCCRACTWANTAI